MLENFLKLPNSGDPVTAGKVNLPFRTLDQNVRYIWEVLRASTIGSTIFLRRQPIEAAAQVGMALWRNPATSQYERGLATVNVDTVTGVLATSPMSQVWGVLTAKHSATLGDICLFGVVPLDIAAAVDGTVTDGNYYLSGSNPGKLSLQRPPVSVAVLRYAAGMAFVIPQFADFLDRHTHLKYSLHCRPSGQHTPPAPGTRHVITDADSNIPGWLPASHSAFNGLAPAGAVFGYNLTAHPALKNAWPPLPATNAYLEIDRGTDQAVGGTGVPLGADGLCIIDRNGLWWLSDCYGDVPWPTDYASDSSASYSDSASAECPRHLVMALTVYMTKPTFISDATSVLSLRSADDRIRIRCVSDPDRTATTGDLEISLDLSLSVVDGQEGYTALKDFDTETGRFTKGRMVEGVYSRSANVSLTGDHSFARTIDGVERTLFQGGVGVTVDPADSKILDVQLVRLEGAEEAFYDEPPLMYIAFPSGDEKSYRAKLYVPDDLAIADPQLKLRLTILGRGVGTLPQLTLTGRRVSRPTAGLTVPADLPDSGDEFTITCVTTATLTDTNQYVEAESEEFEVAAGDTVFFTVQRNVSDGYTAEVGVLKQIGVVVAGA